MLLQTLSQSLYFSWSTSQATSSIQFVNVNSQTFLQKTASAASTVEYQSQTKQRQTKGLFSSADCRLPAASLAGSLHCRSSASELAVFGERVHALVTAECGSGAIQTATARGKISSSSKQTHQQQQHHRHHQQQQ